MVVRLCEPVDAHFMFYNLNNFIENERLPALFERSTKKLNDEDETLIFGVGFLCRPSHQKRIIFNS